MRNNITNKLSKSQSRQSLLGTEANHVPMVLLAALHAKKPLWRSVFLSQKSILELRWCSRHAHGTPIFYGEQDNDVNTWICSGAFDCSTTSSEVAFGCNSHFSPALLLFGDIAKKLIKYINTCNKDAAYQQHKKERLQRGGEQITHLDTSVSSELYEERQHHVLL